MLHSTCAAFTSRHPSLTHCVQFHSSPPFYHLLEQQFSCFLNSRHCDMFQTTLFHVCMELMHLGQSVLADPLQPLVMMTTPENSNTE